MTEREVETTVYEEKTEVETVEVENSYVEEKTVTDTVVFCDACGESCEENGGWVPLVTESQVDVNNYLRDVRYAMSNAIEDRFISDSDGGVTVTVNSPIETVSATSHPPPVYTTSEQYIVDGQSVAIVDADSFKREIDDAIARVDFDHTPDHDLCANCRAALDETGETLATSLYEPPPDDDTDTGRDELSSVGDWQFRRLLPFVPPVAPIVVTGIILGEVVFSLLVAVAVFAILWLIVVPFGFE